MTITPYLMFDGNCLEAMTFYRDIFGAEFGMISRFGEMPGDSVPEDYRDRIMHMNLNMGSNTFLMASDYAPGMVYTVEPGKSGVHLSVSFDDVGRMEDAYKKLSEQGNIQMALQDTFWGERFAMLSDKYGFSWMLSCRIEMKTQPGAK